MPESMHDWTLLNIRLDWESGKACAEFTADEPSVIRVLIAEGVRELHVPRTNAWGPSVSVNRASDVILATDGTKSLTIQMQSGDEIRIVANDFTVG